MNAGPHLAGHGQCLAAGEHLCQQPSGRSCYERCGQPAGTWWGPYWCPDCDSRRLARIDAVFEALARGAS